MWAAEDNLHWEATLEAPATPAAPPARVARPLTNPVPPTAILGVPFDHVTLPEAMALVDRMVASGQPHYVVTANVDFLVQARHDVELRRILLEAHLVLCDGTPLVWASRWLGHRLPERVAGSDLVPELLRQAAEKKHRIFFLGGQSEVAEAAIARLKARHPHLVVAGHYSPPFAALLEMDQREIRRRIRRARPDILFVSLGCPKAEKWMAMNYRSLGVPVTIGVGATIDFLAGRVKRAPQWMRQMGMEWIFRLVQEPRRLAGRYATDLRQFGWAMAQQWWTLRGRSGHASAAAASQFVLVETAWQRIQAAARLDAAAACRDAALARQTRGRHCLLDLAPVEHIDSTGIGWLTRWHRQQQATGHQLVLLNPSGTVQRALRRMRLESFFLIARDPVEARQFIRERERQAAGLVMAPSAHPTQPLLWQGEITAANAASVWRRARRLIHTLSAQGQAVTIDVSGLRFIDSTGASLLWRAKQWAQNHGAPLRFTGFQPSVQNVLRLAGLEGRLREGAA